MGNGRSGTRFGKKTRFYCSVFGTINNPMEYENWIERERRYRSKILGNWPEARDEGIYRICQDCGEVCICMEASCPNCDSSKIVKQKLDLNQECLAERIRCRLRYERILVQV